MPDCRQPVLALPNFASLALLGALAFGPSTGWSQDQASPGRLARESHPDSMLTEALRRIDGDALALTEAVQQAMNQSTAARQAEADLEAAIATVRRERGSFDPEVFASVERSGDDQQTTSPFSGADVLEVKHTTATAGARIRLPFGTEVEAAIATDRTESNSSFIALNPEDAATSRLEFRQPLLAGFGPGTRGDLTAAERLLEAARARRDGARLSVRSDVERNYWELYAAERDLAVQNLIVERAAAILEQASVRADAGLIGPNQVASARVFLAEQRLTELDRLESLDQVSDRLASLVGVRPRAAERFHATDAPPERFPPLEEEALVARAMTRNPGLIAARLDVESLAALARSARWNALPALDLFGSIGGHGLGGEPQTVIFGADTTRTAIAGSTGDAIREAVARDYPTWSLGLELTVPLFRREGRGERDRLNAGARRGEEQVRAQAQAVEEAVRARAQELRHGSRRLELAREAVAAAGEQVRIGVIEFENGRVSAFELVRLGADLASAQQRYSDALVRTASAAAGLRALLGGELE